MPIRYGSVGVDPTRTIPPAPVTGGSTGGYQEWVELGRESK